ncbi:MAG: hypothetical protein RIS41_2117 [Actinomycetota bacterium]
MTSTCDIVLGHDFPDLAVDRRHVVVSFVVGRLGVLPGPMRLGVSVVATLVAGVRTLGGDGVIVRLSRMALPLVGEYFRLLRSLSYAYIWETWPDTTPTGAESRTRTVP